LWREVDIAFLVEAVAGFEDVSLAILVYYLELSGDLRDLDHHEDTSRWLDRSCGRVGRL
jgi:hypothetical protein